jgi:pyruvate kinase
MLIRTKIIATVGPACEDRGVLLRLYRAGADVFRINFSHGLDEQRESFLGAIRDVEREVGRPVAVLGDLCGPKIRVGSIPNGPVALEAGGEIVIRREPIEGDARRISTTLPELIDEADLGEAILLNDGQIRLKVTEVRRPDEIVCRIARGGMLSSGKGVNLPETQLSLSALTEKDRADARWIAQREFDYVALSFVQRADDVRALRELLDEAGSDARIVAKIEKPCAVAHIDEIIDAADAVMVARGDLGVEMDLPAVPTAQKRIARNCHCLGKPCIVATQMLESMTHSAVPTRAEVSDVANAVLDFTDAVMLSGETAVGSYPVEAVTMMNDIVRQMQTYHDDVYTPLEVTGSINPTVAALAGGVQAIASREQIEAVAVYTVSGATALTLAKNRINRPILAISPHVETCRRMSLYYGVVPVLAETAPVHTRDVLATVDRLAMELGIARAGEKILVVTGRPLGVQGSANTVVVHSVRESDEQSG